MKGTSKLRSPHLSADRPLQRLRGCFLGYNTAVPPAYWVKVQKCAGFVDILDVCKFTTFCDLKGYSQVLHLLDLRLLCQNLFYSALLFIIILYCDEGDLRAIVIGRVSLFLISGVVTTAFWERCSFFRGVF